MRAWLGTRRMVVAGLAATALAMAFGAAPAAAAGKKVIGWSMSEFDNPVNQVMMTAARQLAEQNGIELIFADGKSDPAVQASQLENFIAQKVDGIILKPAISDPLIPAIRKVNQAGIPLIVVDRYVFPRGQPIKWDAFVGFDIVKTGTLGGEQIVKALNGKGNLVIIDGLPGAGSTIDRGKAFHEVIDKYPGIKVIADIPADFNRAKAQQVVENILQRFPKGQIDAMYFLADEMVLGGIQAIRDAGRLHEFTIVSTDGNKEAMDLLRNGEIDYESIFLPDDQAVAVNVMADIVNGRKPNLENQVWQGRKMDYLQRDGMPWVRPTVYPVDKTNANLPEYKGW
jgi:ribose transport system substrate-binding protein